MNIAIVTGASSGMGREFARRLSDYVQVDEIWAIARREDALTSLKDQLSTPVRPVPLDLLREESFQRFSQMLEAEKPRVSLLVNAAGFGKMGSSDHVSLDDDCRMIDLNVKALVRMTRLCLPYMDAGSHILELASLSSFQPVPYLNTYAATKAFVQSYSRGLNQELKSRGIRVMALNPGWVKTEFFDHAMKTNTGEVTHFDPLMEPEYIVSTALHDLYKTKKDSCVPNFRVKAQVLAVKLLPHTWVMKIWIAQQKKPKNNKELTTK